MEKLLEQTLEYLESKIPDVPKSTRDEIDNPWHPCSYFDMKLHHDGTWEDGKWYEWMDCHGNIEYARMKLDAYDHFYPGTDAIREEEVVAFRERRN